MDEGKEGLGSGADAHLGGCVRVRLGGGRKVWWDHGRYGPGESDGAREERQEEKSV